MTKFEDLRPSEEGLKVQNQLHLAKLTQIWVNSVGQTLKMRVVGPAEGGFQPILTLV